MSITRLISIDDAPTLTELLRVNRDFLAPWDPIRIDDYFTEGFQRNLVSASLVGYEQGSVLPRVILDESKCVVGCITLSGIVRGPFQSCVMGRYCI
ncbi:MAG TPA: hypothetical protein VMV52_02470 [Candidatus Nanopelagicaceae bacterium]|nr:hypothetical protein [Candidatus Nanopelagicaceae bacterium]